MGQLIWYTTKVGSDVENVTRELAVHMSHPGMEHWRSLGSLIGYLKGKYTKLIITINPKVLKSIIFCYSNYGTDKETRNSISGVVTTRVVTLLMYSSNTPRTFTLISTEAEYVPLLECPQ